MSQPIQKTGFWREYWTEVTSLEENALAHNILAKFNDFLFILLPIAYLLLSLRMLFLKVPSMLIQNICVIWVSMALAIYLVQIVKAIKTFGFRRVNALTILLMPCPLLIISKPSNFPNGVLSPFWFNCAFLFFVGIGTIACYGMVLRHRRPLTKPKP